MVADPKGPPLVVVCGRGMDPQDTERPPVVISGCVDVPLPVVPVSCGVMEPKRSVGAGFGKRRKLYLSSLKDGGARAEFLQQLRMGQPSGGVLEAVDSFDAHLQYRN